MNFFSRIFVVEAVCIALSLVVTPNLGVADDQSTPDVAEDPTPAVVEDLPGDEVPIGDLPGDDLPGDDLPIEDLPGDDLPIEDLPGDLGSIGDPEGNLGTAGFTESEMLVFMDIPVVVTASRSAQPMNQSSVAITVVSSDDIHFGGFTTVPQMIQFVPGVDILQADRNNSAIGIHGLHHNLADRTLLLIDGQDATNPVFGGADFYRIPLFPEDIERIEVVRGPGGAAWGANAFHGVINVITKSPEDTQGFLASTTWNEFGDSLSFGRWGHQIDDLSWRVSFGYEDRESSEDAIENDDFDSTDMNRNYRLNSQVVKELADANKLTFGFSHIHSDRGVLEFGGLPQPGQSIEDERLDLFRMNARLDFELDHQVAGHVAWLGVYEDVNRPNLWRYQSYENDLEAQFSIESTRNTLTVGGNFRYFNINTIRERDTDALATGVSDEYFLGAFLIDRYEVTDRLALEGQIRADWYSGTKTDWSGRGSVLYSLDDDDDQILRLSIAKAFRAPFTSTRELDVQRFPLPSPPFAPGSFISSSVPAKNIDHERIFSYEAGYSARLNEELSTSVNGYYQRLDDIIGQVATPGPFPPMIFLGFQNLEGADAYGIEWDATYRVENALFKFWYAYNGFELDNPDQAIRGFFPAAHKMGLTGRVNILEDLTFNTNFKFVSMTRNDPELNGSVAFPEPEAPSYHQLDLSIAKGFNDGQGELMIGVWDLLDETGFEVESGGSRVTHETPGRTFYIRLQFNL